MAELEVWMRVGQPLEPVLADQERILDAWQSGGVGASSSAAWFS